MPTDPNTPQLHHASRGHGAPAARRLCALTLVLLAGVAPAADAQQRSRGGAGTESMARAGANGGPGQATGGFELGRLRLIPYASGRYTRESNVFRFSREVAAVTGTEDTADRVQRYDAGLDALYNWQRQKLMASIEGRRFTYDTHDDLDHSERQLQLSYVGTFHGHTKAMFDLSDERRLASFEDRRSTDRVIEEERIARAGVGVAVKPEWQIVGGLRHGRLDSPLPEAPALPRSNIPRRAASPDFRLEETAVSAGVQYGIENLEHPELEAPLLAKLVLEHETVRFKNFVPDDDGQSAEDYRLLGLKATAQYAVSGLSMLNASLGATRFESLESGAESSIELTGEITYTRKLTAVTELNARLFRRFSPFVPSADVTTDTGFGVGARWEPIRDIALLLDYSRTESDFGGVGGGSRENSGREDTAESATFSIVYTRFEYFGLRLFGARNERESNEAFNNYSDDTVGAELSFRWE